MRSFLSASFSHSMPAFDYAASEVLFRFIVTGPGDAGKATVLRQLHAGVESSQRGELCVRPIGDDKIVRFDFTPVDIIQKDKYRPRAEFLTLSGRSADRAHWARLFAAVDAVLFVADSRPEKMEGNRAFLEEVAAQPSLAEVPVVFLYNKRDVPAALAVAEMDRLLNPAGAPAFQTTATTGEGLAHALAALCALALT